jgi:biopolymer transport protein TolQ
MPVDTAVSPVDASTLAGSMSAHIAAHDFSVWAMFLNADIIVKAVMLLLLLASFWGWAIIFDKWLTFRNLKAKSNKFENEFWSAEALDKFYERAKKKASHPMLLLFTTAMEEFFRSKVKDMSNVNMSQRLSIRERINLVMQVARNREIEKLENGLGFLATTGSSAPFVGLFGTVWGIMHSFTSIAAEKNATLVTVAPGIAEALLATAIGLFAAIPAVIAYNKFSGELDKFAGKLEDFSSEFNTLISRQIEG